MASEDAELDLYADDIGDEFSQENEYKDSDLYDDVITSNTKSRGEQEPSSFNGSSNQSQNSNVSNNSMMANNSSSHNESNSYGSSRKPSIYVGNLTWWTTDEDVARIFNEVGITDVMDIKFFENRANGQSKGFCVVNLGSDSSVRNAIEKLPKCELYGQNPAVTLCNRQNLSNFEMKSRKPGQNGQPNTNNNPNYMQNHRNNYGQNSAMSGRPPLIQRPMRPSLLNSQPRMPPLQHQSLSYGGAAQPWSQMLSNGPRNNPMNSLPNTALNAVLRLPGRQLGNQPLLNAPSGQNDLRTQLSSVPGLGGVPGHALSASHPALFQSQQGYSSQSAIDQFSSRLAGVNSFGSGGHHGNDFGRSSLDLGLQMSEAEFEELLNKNKILAQNAITRAVTDTSSGDFAAAIDTLSTAISLIKQSRVSHDERCKAIILSLQDTLQSIEQKMYTSGGDRSRKDRPRSRERSRERGSSRRDKSSRRDRSRSREREYRERSRDRYRDDHYHEERYRDKERERDHRGRH